MKLVIMLLLVVSCSSVKKKKKIETSYSEQMRNSRDFERRNDDVIDIAIPLIWYVEKFQ